MFRKSILVQSVLMTMIAPSAVLAEVEATVELRNETAVYINEGQTIGQATSMLDNGDKNSAGELMKFQNQAKIFLNGDIGEDSSWHGELQLIYDTEAVNDEANGGVNYKGHRNYTQNDYLRELYVDTEAAGWSWRLGKQQVVWGTADGIKLLDIINPTDFREVNQNVMEDARIPIWMINGERYFDNGGNLQVIVSQVEENKIPGLNPGGDQGHPFIMKGVDTISGQVNGFYNVAPKLANVAGTFNAAADWGAFTGGGAAPGSFLPALTAFGNLTVQGFAGGTWNFNPATFTITPDPAGTPGSILLNQFAQFGFTGFVPLDPNGNFQETNLLNVTGPGPADVVWAPSAGTASSAFELMSNATFLTFNTFTNACAFGPDCPTGFTGYGQSQWVRDTPDDEANAGFRYKNSTESGINYSINYFYHYGANPGIDLDWVNSSGNVLAVQRAPSMLVAGPMSVADISQDFTRAEARANHDPTDPTGAGFTNILVHDGTYTTYYGAIDPSNPGVPGAGAPILRFTETYHRVNSLGASFDMAVDSLDFPLVLRGEFLYDQGDKQPVVDKYLLSIGDLTNALKMEDADYFKYVIGADITVMTNLLVSAQFIQFWNLDYVDQPDQCFTQDVTGVMVDCGRYTADFSTMHLTNGLQKGWENKEFVSLFLSKPIGVDQLGRWNNITIWEEGGGWWNRLDAEYSVTDQFIVSAEWNQYFGDENTTFGQLDKSSNVQVGFRYIFEDY